MRRWMVFAVGLFALILSVRAEKRISVAQLEQTIAQLKGTPDAESAQRLSDLKLTERVSAERFASLTRLMPGEKMARYASWWWMKTPAALER
jgi:hypothetical protein